ncbi:hypothetical protein 3 [Hubei picorna-like virus 72]|uniref:hypothetical protein 3 n=1 Tax=Hubei picorna-like virus 72 TaxID=1923156 RepID=UPI000909CEFE|nr:hypothetical protein 3 [Hubei picorna-like virus 72]APG78444.1 hypothetical protein 3 [Hubei picorna-like virus 72]
MSSCDTNCFCKRIFAINPNYSKFLESCLYKPIAFSDYHICDRMASGRLLITFNRNCQLWTSTGDNLPPCHAIMHVSLQNPGKFFKVADLTKDFPHFYKNDIPTFLQHLNGHGMTELNGYIIPIIPSVIPKNIHMLLMSILFPILPSVLQVHTIDEGCSEITVEDYFNKIKIEYPTLYPLVNNDLSKRNANQVVTSLNRVRECISLILFNPRTMLIKGSRPKYQDAHYSTHMTYNHCNVNHWMLDETFKFFDPREIKYSHICATRMIFSLRVKWFNLLAMLNPSVLSPIQNSTVCLFCGALRSGPDPKGLVCDDDSRIEEEIVSTSALSPRVRPVLVGKVNDGIGHWSGVTHLEFDKLDSCHVNLNVVETRYFDSVTEETFIHPRELERMDGVEDPNHTKDDLNAYSRMIKGMRTASKLVSDYVPDGEI